jgi:hypothetical protein
LDTGLIIGPSYTNFKMATLGSPASRLNLFHLDTSFNFSYYHIVSIYIVMLIFLSVKSMHPTLFYFSSESKMKVNLFKVNKKGLSEDNPHH